MKRMLLCALALVLIPGAARAADVPKPFGPVPSPRQLRWHDLGMYGFIHFTLNTFNNREMGYGDESPKIFDPADFDADAIAHGQTGWDVRPDSYVQAS